jgi:hypothetical protein
LVVVKSRRDCRAPAQGERAMFYIGLFEWLIIMVIVLFLIVFAAVVVRLLRG